MSRSPRTVTQTSTTAPPAWLQAQQQDFLGRANALSQQEYQPYTGQLVQGLTGDQQQARQMLRDRIASGGSQQFRDGRTALDGIIGGGSYTAPGRVTVGDNDFLGRTTEFDAANPYGGRTTELGQNSFIGQTTSFDPSNPMAGRRAEFSGVNPYAGREVAFSGQNAMIGQRAQFNPTANRFLGATTPVGSNEFLGAQTQVARNRYLDEDNPYLQQVIDSTTGDVTRAFNLQQAPAQLAQFAMGGAFGGTAHLQAMQESQRALAQELGRTASGLRSEDFNARRQLAESEADRITSTRLSDLGRNAGLAQDGLALRANIAQGDLGRNASLLQQGLQFGADLADRGISRDADLLQRNSEFGAQLRQTDLARNADLAQRNAEFRANLDNQGIDRDADLFQRSNEFGAQLRQSDLDRNSQLQQDWLRTRASLDQADLGRNADLSQRNAEFAAQLQQADLARNAGLAQDMLGLRFNADTGNRDAEQRAREFADSQRLSALGLLPGFEDMGIRDIEALNDMGAEEREYLQQLLAAQYGQFLDARDWDAQRLGIYGDALGRVAPHYQNTTGTSPNPNYQSRGQQILGGGLALAGLGI